MNPMDRTLASGDWRPMPATFPMVLGADGVGVVEKLGEGVKVLVGNDLFGQLLIPPLAQPERTPSMWPLPRMRRW